MLQVLYLCEQKLLNFIFILYIEEWLRLGGMKKE